jgi:protein-disulfide isomerase
VPKSKKRKEVQQESPLSPKVEREQRLQRITTYTGIAALAIVVAIIGFYLLANRSPNSRTAVDLPDVDLSAVDFRLDAQPSMGDPAAPVKIVEFADFKCPACKAFHENVFPQLKREYIDTGLVEFTFINFQFLAPDSVMAGIAGECIYQQSETAFWQYYDAVFKNQGSETASWATPKRLLDLVRQYVSESEIDEAELELCLAEERYRKDVEEDLKIGRSAGVRATPTIFINKKKFVGAGPYSKLKAIIERELERSQP